MLIITVDFGIRISNSYFYEEVSYEKKLFFAIKVKDLFLDSYKTRS